MEDGRQRTEDRSSPLTHFFPNRRSFDAPPFHDSPHARTALFAPVTTTAQGGRGNSRAADSIKYVYPTTPQLEKLKTEAAALIDGEAKQIQEMVDMVFSFGEPGFQEFETVKYLTGILEQNGFKVERNVAGIPTRCVATWGSGKPVISLGSDIDDI